MKSLLARPEMPPQTPATTATEPQPLARARWGWNDVRRILIVRLRSIGDTVLATPSFHALRRFLPGAQIDVLLEDWVAPVLEGCEDINNVITIRGKSARARARVVRRLRSARYDVAYNLHGGTTATLLTRASGARHRVGYRQYQYWRLHNHVAPPAPEIWGRPDTHTVENQMALFGWTGVPVTDLPPSRLAVVPGARERVERKLVTRGTTSAVPFALVHPAAAFESKQWEVDRFARVIEWLAQRGLPSVVITGPAESALAEDLARKADARFTALTDLTLPEVSALAARSRLFVGNDSGIAHIAAAVGAPSVVIFGSSSVVRWRPWATAASAVVREEMECAPCPGYTCAVFDSPQCIRRVPVERVTLAIESVLERSANP